MAGRDVHVGPGGGEPTFAPLPPEWFEAQWGDTVHIEAMDRWGNIVSATPSGGWLQGSPAVAGLGFPISTRGQICWLEPGHPSTLRPGGRPRTTLTPTLVTRDGEAWLGIGTPGGDQQDQWSLVTFLRILHHRMTLQQAIDAPLLTTRHMPQSFHPRPFDPAKLVLEGRFPETTVAALRARGHVVTVEAPWSLGRVCAVARSGGFIRAGASPRFMQGYAIGR
jgi:gamma-glutamyltranspeptidase/glutathione hydrolase